MGGRRLDHQKANAYAKAKRVGHGATTEIWDDKAETIEIVSISKATKADKRYFRHGKKVLGAVVDRRLLAVESFQMFPPGHSLKESIKNLRVRLDDKRRSIDKLNKKKDGYLRTLAALSQSVQKASNGISQLQKDLMLLEEKLKQMEDNYSKQFGGKA